jgi:hypothetical protein
MKFLPGFLHYFLRWDGLRAAGADFGHARCDLGVPSGFDFGCGKILDTGHQFLREFDSLCRRPVQHSFFDGFWCSRHEPSVPHEACFCKAFLPAFLPAFFPASKPNCGQRSGKSQLPIPRSVVSVPLKEEIIHFGEEVQAAIWVS